MEMDGGMIWEATGRVEMHRQWWLVVRCGGGAQGQWQTASTFTRCPEDSRNMRSVNDRIATAGQWKFFIYPGRLLDAMRIGAYLFFKGIIESSVFVAYNRIAWGGCVSKHHYQCILR